MPEANTPTLRIHRVTTRRRTLRELNCPLEPELLVAEFANELPPEVAVAVREHIAICETCGARSQALRAPYELLASLGHEPVDFVPDLRDTIRTQTGAHRFTRDVARAAATVGRGGVIGLSGLAGLVLIALVVIGGIFVTANAQAVNRSHNALSHVLSAGPAGSLLAQTDKLVPVHDASGHEWLATEVIVVDERTGAVTRSLPASDGGLRAGQPSDLPVAVAVAADGTVIFELTAPDAQHAQALIAFSATSGAVRFIAPLKLPPGGPLTATSYADALAVAPNGSQVYVGLNTPDPTNGAIRVLVLDAQNGAYTTQLSPNLPLSVSLPPPAGSLPASVFPSVAPTLFTGTYTATLAAHGALVVSSDGQWLFDVVRLSDAHGPVYAAVRRINVYTGYTAQALALPGDFTLAALAVGAPPQSAASQAQTPTATTTPTSASQLYLVKGSPDAQCFVLDPGAKGPLLLGDIPLGGPTAPAPAIFTGTLSVSPALDGAHVYITQNVTARGGQIAGHDLWLVDTQGMSLVTHRLDADSADTVLANAIGGTSSGTSSATPATFLLRGGDAYILTPDLRSAPALWLSLGDGHHIVQLLATIP